MKFASVLVLLLAGCATARPATWQEVGSPLDGRTITIQGAIVASGEFLHLCPTYQTDPSQCLDLVGRKSVENSFRRRVGPQCTSITGTFNAFGEDSVGIGNFHSVVGYIIGSNVGTCPQL